jgi:hypothetical protein
MNDEDIEEYINKLRGYYSDTPQEHLYDWVFNAYPDIFNQWKAVYDIEKGVN